MGHLAELYAAPDYLDQRNGGADVLNKGNEGATASEGVGRYAGGMTGSSWADEQEKTRGSTRQHQTTPRLRTSVFKPSTVTELPSNRP